METLRNGKFSLILSGKDLARGLRKEEVLSRDRHSMTAMSGLIGKDNVLQAISEYSRLDTSVITDAFPYPQIFVLINHIIVCSNNKIYEYYNGSLSLKITTEEGSTWKLVDFIDYLYLSNGKVAVIRTATSGAYSISSDLPIAGAMCNYNGQVLIGSPGIEQTAYSITNSGGSFILSGSAITLT